LGEINAHRELLESSVREEIQDEITRQSDISYAELEMFFRLEDELSGIIDIIKPEEVLAED
jgi:hypothetical protein